MITRREFLQYCTASAAALGLSQTDLLKLERALATPNTGCSYPTPRVIWMSGQACTACQVTLLNRVVQVSGGYYDADMLNALYPTTPVSQGTAADPIGLELNVVNDVTDLVVGDAVRAVVPQLAGARALSWADDLGGVGVLPSPNPFPNGFITLDFVTTVQASAGELSIRHLIDVVENHPFILLVDGAVPSAPASNPTLRAKNEKASIEFENTDYPYTTTPTRLTANLPAGDITLGECLRWMYNMGNMIAAIATGTCSSFGGVPAAQGNPTGAMSLEMFFAQNNINTPLINVPGCPPHPDWMVYPVAYFLIHGSIPTLDRYRRPQAVFSGSTGDQYVPFCFDCPNKDTQGTPQAAQELGQAGCLGSLGCKGPYTVGDCPMRGKNTTDDGFSSNWCVGASGQNHVPDGSGVNVSHIGESRHPCQGCIMPDFPDWASLTTEGDKTSKRVKGFYNG